MKKKLILIVFGTRPEAIKMAPLIHALTDDKKRFSVKVCVTAQHRQMLDQVLKVFQIKPDIDLDIMQSNQDLSDITVKVLSKMKVVLGKYKPDIVLVHGDTTTSLATSIACFYAKVPVGHVEAGLRTHNIYAPFPEELNRQITSKIARWHFAPTSLSKKNLMLEGVLENNITITGNTVIDALFWVLACIKANPAKQKNVNRILNSNLPFNWFDQPFVLITGHRRENFGHGLTEICKAIRCLGLRFKNVHFVYPVHFNPNIRQPVNDLLSNLSNVHLIEPLEYEPFVYLLKHAYLVLTDSGGIQEEAPSLGKPVLVMREVTERPEAVKAGTVKLVGTNKSHIVDVVTRLLKNEEYYKKMSKSHNPYGDGKACQRILKVLINKKNSTKD